MATSMLKPSTALTASRVASLARAILLPATLAAATVAGISLLTLPCAAHAQSEVDDTSVGSTNGSTDSHAIDDDEPLPERTLSPSEEPVFSVDTPIGPLVYGAGRGLEIGHTGLHVGGFSTVEFDRQDGKPGSLELDSVNFLILFEPNEFIRGFAEIEVGDLFHWTTNEDSARSDPNFVIERLYADFRLGDPFALRGGKFLTPIGRWNLVPAEPFVWTPIDPAFLEFAFDEHQTGGAFVGSFYPAGGTLDYWVFSQFAEPLDPSEDPEPADYSIGGRLQYGRTIDQWSIGTSFMATEIDGDWSFLAGIDTEFRIDRLLVTSEFTVQQGKIDDRDLWDLYVQGVYEIVPTFNLVARFEHLDTKGSRESPLDETRIKGTSNLADLGIAWIPKPYLHFRASYRVTDQQTESVFRGFNLSFALVF